MLSPQPVPRREEGSDILASHEASGTPKSSQLVPFDEESVYAEIIVNYSHSSPVSPLGEGISPMQPTLVPAVSSVASWHHSSRRSSKSKIKDTGLAVLSRKTKALVLAESKAHTSSVMESAASNHKPRPSQNIFHKGNTGSARPKIIKYSSNPDFRRRVHAVDAQRTILSKARWNHAEELNNSLDLSNVFGASSERRSCNTKTGLGIARGNSSLDLQEVFGESLDKLDSAGHRNAPAASMRSLGDSTSQMDGRAALAPTCPVRLLSPPKKMNKYCSTPELGARRGAMKKTQSVLMKNAGWDDSASRKMEDSLELSNDRRPGLSRTNSSIDLREVFGRSLDKLDISLAKKSASLSMNNFRVPASRGDQRASLTVRTKRINKYSSTPDLGYKRFTSPTSVVEINQSLDEYSTGNAQWSNPSKSPRLPSKKETAVGCNHCGSTKNIFIQGMSTKSKNALSTSLTTKKNATPLASSRPVHAQYQPTRMHKYSSTPDLGRRERYARPGASYTSRNMPQAMTNAQWEPNNSLDLGNVFISETSTHFITRSRGLARTTSSLDLGSVFGSSLRDLERNSEE